MYNMLRLLKGIELIELHFYEHFKLDDYEVHIMLIYLSRFKGFVKFHVTPYCHVQ